MIDELGKRLSASTLAARLGMGINQVYAHAQELGGVRIGNRWAFYE